MRDLLMSRAAAKHVGRLAKLYASVIEAAGGAGSTFAWPSNAISKLTEVPVVCVFPHVLFGWGVK
jgi:hypothetical protein